MILNFIQHIDKIIDPPQEYIATLEDFQIEEKLKMIFSMTPLYLPNVPRPKSHSEDMYILPKGLCSLRIMAEIPNVASFLFNLLVGSIKGGIERI